jgi:hypothetical protein
MALLGTAVVLGIAAASPSAASAATTCSASRAPGAKVVLASKAAVVFKRRETDPLHGPEWVYYGCLYARDRVRQLSGFAEFHQYFGPWALNGRYVAFAHDYEEAAPDVDNDDIHVFDLRSGKEKYAALATEGSPKAESRVHSLVLKPNASVAWIASYHTDYPEVLFQVWRWETKHNGERRKLDEGKSIAPHSLALSASGGTVYWRHGGNTRTAPLR